MAPTFRSVSSNNVDSTSLVISAPSPMSVGDLLVCYTHVDHTSSDSTAPAGWTQTASQTGGTGGGDFANGDAFYKIADDADTSAADFTFSGSASVPRGGIILAYSAVNTANPIGNVDQTANVEFSTPDQFDIPPANPSHYDSTIVRFASCNDDTSAINLDATSVPAGHANRTGFDAGDFGMVAYDIGNVSPGTVSAVTVSSGDGVPYVAINLELIPEIQQWSGESGVTIGGLSDTVQVFSYTASGGLTIGGDATENISGYNHTASGGVTLGGSASAVQGYIYESSGGLTIGGDATEAITKFNYAGTGGLTIGGDASEAIAAFNYAGSGGLSVSGEADVSLMLSYEATGGIEVLSSPFNPPVVDVDLFFDQTILWDVENSASRDLDLFWNTGPSDVFVYRIQCECLDSTSDPCATTNFDPNDPNCGNNPPAGSTTIKYIAASDPVDLCEKLKRGFITQPFKCRIDRIQRFTRPLDKRRIAALEEEGQDLDCNELVDVTLEGVQECLDFTLESDLIQTIGFTMRAVDSITQVEPEGGFTIGGEAEAGVVPPSADGDGGVTIGGTADVTSTHWNYTPDSETPLLIVSGQGLPTFFYWDYDGTGGVDISGEAEVVSPYHTYEAESGLSLSGSAGVSIRYYFTPLVPQLTIGGSANAYQATQVASGGVSIGGEANVVSSAYSFEASGGIVTSGEANIVSSAFSWESSGGFVLAGFGTPVWRVEGDGGLSIGGEADTLYQLSSDTTGGLTIGGEAGVVSQAYTHVASGGISVGGEISSNFLGEFTVEMGIEMRTTELDVTFGVEEGEPLSIGTDEIRSPCGCGDIPQILQMRHNFGLSYDLAPFLSRNGIDLPSITTLTYRQAKSGWSRNFHFRGNSTSGVGIETWDIYFEFTCSDNVGGEVLQTSVWKFCAFFRRKNLTTGADDDSRMVFTFPSTDVCPTGTFQRLDYSFFYDTQQRTLLTSTGATGTNFVVNDGIRLFSSRDWQLTPDLEIRITAVDIEEPVERVDITPLFPFDPTAPLLTATSN